MTGHDPIVIDALAKRFDSEGRPPVWAVRDFSLTCRAGELTCVLGASGCGKSTLLRMTAGLTKPTEGRLIVNGVPVMGPPADLAMVSQEGDLLPWRRVLANIAIGLELAGVDRCARTDRAMDALRRTGLPERVATALPHELSGGMRQRVALARALCAEPTILLMDEPFSSLDEPSRHRLQGQLMQMWPSQRKALLFVTHNSEEAVFLADRIVVMHAGGKAAEFEVDLPRPRDRMADEFIKILLKVRKVLSEVRPACCP